MLNVISLICLITVAATATPLLNETSVGTDCTITKTSEVSNVIKNCKTIVVKAVSVAAGETLQLHLQSGTKLTFSGHTKFGYGKEWEGPLVEITGKNIQITGEDGSKLDGQGAHYWDGKGDKGTKKPKFMRIKATEGSHFTGLNILNCPHQCVSIQNSQDLTISHFDIDVSDGDTDALGHNTDGFDISASDTVNFEYCTVKNQDDCVAINSGKNLHFSHMTCSGGHGLSLSIGMSTTDSSKNYAESITFQDSTVKASRNAIHVKTHSKAATGYIKDVTYKNIKISGITRYGINVEQDYGGTTGKPTNNIPITGLNIEKVTGSMSGSNTIPIYIMCGTEGCSDFKWSDISITGNKKDSTCTNYVPSGISC